MNDYKELVAELNEEWNACNRLISDKIAINLGMLTEKHYVTLAEDCCGEMVGIMQTIDCAINAIEQLVADYEILAKMYAKVNEELCIRTKDRDDLERILSEVITERDKAIEDISEYKPCVFCKHYGESMCDYPHDDCFEWRGVREVDE